jgi:hypothetical protein
MGEISKVETRDPRLTPATVDEITKELEVLFSVFEVRKDSQKEAENSMVGYVLPLQQYPAWALHAAILKFLDGTIVGSSKKFAPKPPELCEAIRAELAPIIAEETKRQAEAARRRRDEQELGPPSRMTDEHRNRMKLKMAVLSHCGPDVAAECMKKGGLMPYIEKALEYNLPIPEGLVEGPQDERLP